MRVFNQQIQTNVALNTNINGPAVPLRYIFMYTIAAIITGTPTGTVKLQASNDPETNDTMPNGVPAPVPTHWVDIDDSSFPVTTAGETMWNVRYIGYNYVRVVYLDSSGGASTATMTVIFNGKGS